jgi:DNA-binding NtrC family response regulator
VDNSPNKTILVVDDDAGQRSLLKSFLTGQGFAVIAVASGQEALSFLASARPALLISDVRMPGLSGLELLERVREQIPELPVLLVTAYAEVRDAVGAIRSGAVDYLEKPIDLDELLATVGRTLGLSGLPITPSTAGLPLPEGVIAHSEAMQDVLREVALVAPSETRLLITGESGVGKEVVTDIIHRWSPRAHGPLVKVNCAAIPENLLESELFGHEKGAFTGAVGKRIGRFEEADKGTLLLDEIGEMSPALQAKLLRVTQDGAFNRVGSNAEQRTNVRIVAATNRDLEREVEEGRFREDLYYRLNVIEIHVPPLRERRADIVAMAQRFAAEFSRGKPRFSPGAMACMESYGWPGNVRELRNAIERAVLLARGEVILTEHLPKRMQQEPVESVQAEEPIEPGSRMEDVERTTILKALRECQFNRTEAARLLGISRRTLTYRLQTYRRQGYPVDSE